MDDSKGRVGLLAAFAAAAVVGVFSVGPFGDPASYFDFADQRSIFGIPHFMDVLSNVPWAIVGLCGLLFVLRTKPSAPGPFVERWERAACAILFAAVLGMSAGSAYFHLEPTESRLFWDRLPMAVVFMSLFALVIGERIEVGPVSQLKELRERVTAEHQP